MTGKELGRDKLYTTFEIAEIMGVKPRTVRVWLEKGQLAGRGRKLGKSWYVSGDQLLKFFEETEAP